MAGSLCEANRMASPKYVALFSDIGGVLGTNGWDTALRLEICRHFGVEPESIDGRHRLLFDSFERGHLSFETYLEFVFFAQARPFTLDQLRTYVYDASIPWPENIAFMAEVRKLNQLKLALISNEGQGITEHRITKFGLGPVVDFMVMSHFTGHRKPDPAIWKLALNLAGVEAQQSIYIDDREVFAEFASRLGFTSIHHTSLESTRAKLAALGLATPKLMTGD